MSIVRINGARLTDVCFTVTIGGETICWNTTKIERAATAGAFGDPIEIQLSILPPPIYGNVDRAKLDRFKRDQSILDLPVIAIDNPPGHHSGCRMKCFVDGNHRTIARQELQLSTLRIFVVPHNMERNFRITEETIP
jgi:hypothetical protein